MQKLRDENRVRESVNEFEQWLNNKMSQRLLQQQSGRVQATYNIPVVVHVIHNGEPIGTGSNISEAQILSQLKVLNEDFNRTNPDAVNTPTEFLPVAGSLDIQFVLAKTDPQGLATNGIVRVQGSKTSWTVNDNYQLKSESYWPAEDYLNIWVCNLSGLLGYAQFPVSDLTGHENSSTNRLTDGVVVRYDVFGSSDDGITGLNPSYNKGRTATHEIGHFLGLHHIWGEESSTCSDTDYVTDTPNQLTSTSGCPAHPKASCSSNDMFMNFLDYTYDNCMNLFTQGQVGRMITVLSNSPRRASLLTSYALNDPLTVPDNAGIVAIVSPASVECSTASVPQLIVKNFGTNQVTTVRITIEQDNVLIDTQDFDVDLASNETTTVTFPAIALVSDQSLKFEIIQTNGVTDGDALNNSMSVAVHVPDSGDIPLIEDFSTMPGGWEILNPDETIGWQLVGVPNGEPGNNAIKVDFYNYEYQGEADVLYSPVFDFSGIETAALYFDVAYAQFPGVTTDELRVYILTECGATFFQGDLAYSKKGSVLSTHSATSSPFVPSGASDWRQEFVNLDDYVGESVVRIAFVAINGYGNNLYLDNISLLSSAEEDIAISGILSPDPVICTNSPPVMLEVYNYFEEDVTSFDLVVTLNGIQSEVQYDNVLIQQGQSLVVDVEGIVFNQGVNQVLFEIRNPNGKTDTRPDNNSIETSVVLHEVNDHIPIREKFESGFGDWVTADPQGGFSWSIRSTNYGLSAYVNSFANPNKTLEAWLVSPSLDMTISNSASMHFDLSYAKRNGAQERLRILASTDCGGFNQLLWDSEEAGMPGSTSETSWVPSTSENWERIAVDMYTLAGNPSVRIAFVVTNENGNNLYIDNIEFYTSDNLEPPQIEDLFALRMSPPGDPADFYITFNLEERQPVQIDVMNAMGQQVFSAMQPDILNQDFPVDAQLSPGVYIVRMRISTKLVARRVVVPE